MDQARVFEIVAQMVGAAAEDITLDSSPDNIETWDSLASINLLLALEEEFGVAFSDQQIQRLTSVRAILEVLAEAGA